MSPTLEDRFETRDGSRPEATPLADSHGQALALGAFSLLAGGDVFERPGAGPPPGGREKAEAYAARFVLIEPHGAPVAAVRRVQGDIVRQLSANPRLVERMRCTKPLHVDLIPGGKKLSRYGYPRAATRHAAGFFWDRPDWDTARIALRQDALDDEAALVVHEMAHAIHYLGFTRAERQLIYDLLRPTFGSRAAMDEVFAIYSERELYEHFGGAGRAAPGVYGYTRRHWSEDHIFTRFVRKLYFPHKPAAGPKMAPLADEWSRFSGG